MCDRGIVFHRGEIVFDGGIETSIDQYKRVNGLG
jgi:lipopolysaccharide transport system ATP-binding protein